MTTVEAPVLIVHSAEYQSSHPDAAVPTADVPSYTECGGYKEAKHLAASRCHDGTHASAVFVVALDRWCVR